MKFILFYMLACTSDETQKIDTSNTNESNEGENNEGENNEGESQNTDDVICSQISLDECASFEECELLSGSPIVINEDGDECIDYSNQDPTTCVEYGCSAEPTITIARPPDSEECWFFASGCLPEGWSYCDSNPQDCQ